MNETPAQMGYRMPAEWEPHQAVWLSWPHKRESWPGKFETVEPIVAEAVAALAGSELVRINVLDGGHEAHVTRLLEARGVDLAGVRFHRFPTNDAWCRDHGAIFVVREHGGHRELAATDWDYNAWGGKYPPFDRDVEIPRRMAAALGVPRYVADMVLEGGSIDVNGAGVLITTEQCLLNPNRNPHLNRAQIEANLRAFLGVHTIWWLGDGIAGDDTDGHVDDLTRFVAEDVVVTVVEDDPGDANYPMLQENLGRLRSLRMPGGRPPRIVTLPMPEPVIHEGQRLPASYANFYIGNTVILQPTFNCARDRTAVETIQRCFPTRRVVGIDCTDLVWGLGTFHCLSQQVPAV
ncbi:MAG: Agmatine deiminase [Gammaproteobacteria bacterium]|nr:Agmatine deiminase [Gammaproteobacteria bacterium]